MSDPISLSVNDAPLLAVLSDIARKGSDATPAMEQIAGRFLFYTEEAFANEGYPTKWPPFAASTLAAIERRNEGKGKGRKRSPAKLEQDTGQLAASVQTEVGRDYVQIGSNKPQAAVQHLGGATGRGHASILPARHYLPFQEDGDFVSDELRGEVLDILSRFVLGVLE